MNNIIKTKLCDFCINCNEKNCLKMKTKKRKDMIIYMCENYKGKKEVKKFSKYIKYTYYDEVGNYIAIIKNNVSENVIIELKKEFDEVKYKE